MADPSTTEENRPDPEALLAAVEKADGRLARGRLKVFFGAAPGVGKTYAMLRYGIDEQQKGRDVLVGVVETHQRSETQTLANQLPLLPLRVVEGASAAIGEFDLDAALARRPQLLLLDELAHNNARGSRHSKRWQDLEELLAAGINVATTINVQHLESVNDVVFAITGVRVRETVPDRAVTDADEVNLIDISEEDLLQRLRDNKVYLGERGARAMHHFFRKGNLIALRQLAMRVAADRMDTELQEFHSIHPEDRREGGRLREVILVAIGADAESEQLIRAGYRLSQALHCSWIIIHVDTPRGLWQRPQYQAWLWSHFHLAERLGAETVRITGVNVAQEILAYAHTRQVTRIMTGSWTGIRQFWPVRRSPLRQLLRYQKAIDIIVYPLQPPAAQTNANPVYVAAAPRYGFRLRDSRAMVLSMIGGFAVAGLATLLNPYLGMAAFFLLTLAGATLTALRFGRWPAIVLISSAQIGFFLFGQGKNLPATLESLLIVAATLTVTVLISQLVARSRDQEIMARLRERRARTLYTLVQRLSLEKDSAAVLRAAVAQIHSSLGLDVGFWLPAGPGGSLPLQRWDEPDEPDAMRNAERSAAIWVFRNQRPAGMGTDTLSAVPTLLLPLLRGDRVLGIMGIGDMEIKQIPGEWLRYMETIARLISAALDSADNVEQRDEAQILLRLEQTQNTLLSAISHDLRTPLTTVSGLLSTMEELGDNLSSTERLDLVRTLREQTQRISDTMERILRTASLLSRKTELQREWIPFGDIVSIANSLLGEACKKREFQYQIAQDLPLLFADARLIAQVLANLLDNACRYTPAEAAIVLQAWVTKKDFHICVIDYGYGIPSGRVDQIFARFSQVRPPTGEGGTGLGLAIAKSIVEMHGGQINASNITMGRGARFCFTLPLQTQPTLPEEE
ncbi:ATP-binding protein [Acidithiobacillus sp. IBUN Pt1247-S3]|uniref:ATP-binding protein n=1 Tax=Acidithiobacillus sp. IBUN Pt1247-S3 TaxID=3166642 RepID=UPI0034E5D832